MASAIQGLILVITLGIGYSLMAEGFFGATLMLMNVIFSGLIAFSYYEPLAKMLADAVPNLSGSADMFSLFGLMLISFIILRNITLLVAKRDVRFPKIVELLGRVVMGFGCAAVLMGMLLLGMATAPVHKDLFSTIKPDDKPPFGLGLDGKWLAMLHQATGVAFARYGDAGARQFDGDGQWVANHRAARPYEGEPEAPAAPAK